MIMSKKNKHISFGGMAKKTYNKYYNVRKPGEDALTDEAYNREMKELSKKNLQAKAEHESKNPSQEQLVQDTGMQNPMRENGGRLPMFFNGGGVNNISSTNSEIKKTDFVQNPYYELNKVNNSTMPQMPYGNYQYPSFKNVSVDPEPEPKMDESDILASNLSTGLDFSKNRETDVINRDALNSDVGGAEGFSSEYSRKANMLGPLATIAGNAIASGISAKGVKDQYKRLMDGLKSSKVDANTVDFSRERTNIDSNQALSEATVRQNAKNLGNSFASTQLQNLGRVQAQRTAGNLKAMSYQREEQLNQAARNQADRINIDSENQTQRQRTAIESQYGGVSSRIWSDFAQSAVGSAQNYMAEDQRIKQDDNYLNMVSDNYKLDYQQAYEQMTPTQRRLADMGIITPKMKKKVTRFGQNKLNT